MKSLTLLLIIIIPALLLSQTPDSYKLLKDKGLDKILETRTPLSNSVSDIIALGDTVWLGTSRGVSLSTDNGESWTNFFGNEAFGSESVPAIAYDKYHDVIWASTAHSKDVSGSSLPEGSGLHYTTDHGDNLAFCSSTSR